MNLSGCNQGLQATCRRKAIQMQNAVFCPVTACYPTGALALSDGTCLPLLYWRHDYRYLAMKSCITDGIVGGISTIKAHRICSKTEDMAAVLYRELDLCQWLVDGTILWVYALSASERAVTLLAEMDNGAAVTMDVATTLPEGAEPIDRHEIFTQHGCVTDRTVDTQIPQHSVYVFCEENLPQSFLDIDVDLFGLTMPEVACVNLAEELLSGKVDADSYRKQGEWIKALVQKTLLSANSLKRTMVEVQ